MSRFETPVIFYSLELTTGLKGGRKQRAQLLSCCCLVVLRPRGGWSGGAKVLGKLSVPGRPTSLDDSRARVYCAFNRCGWGLFGNFFSHLSFLFLSPSLWETARYRLKYCLKGPLSPKQPTNHYVHGKHLWSCRDGQ